MPFLCVFLFLYPSHGWFCSILLCWGLSFLLPISYYLLLYLIPLFFILFLCLSVLSSFLQDCLLVCLLFSCHEINGFIVLSQSCIWLSISSFCLLILVSLVLFLCFIIIYSFGLFLFILQSCSSISLVLFLCFIILLQVILLFYFTFILFF